MGGSVRMETEEAFIFKEPAELFATYLRSADPIS